MYLKRREFFIGVENRVFQQNRPEPFIRVAEICTNPIAAYRSGPAPRLLWWRIGGIGHKPTLSHAYRWLVFSKTDANTSLKIGL